MISLATHFAGILSIHLVVFPDLPFHRGLSGLGLKEHQKKFMFTMLCQHVCGVFGSEVARDHPINRYVRAAIGDEA